MRTWDVLRSTQLFKDLADRVLEIVFSAGHQLQVEKDGFFFLQGDPAEKVYVLTAGRVRMLQTSSDGQQVILRLITPHHEFGGIALVPQSVYPASAQAAEDSTALGWTQQALLALAEKNPRLAFNAMQLMAGHAVESQDRLREMATERVERRLARAVLRLARQSGRRSAAGIEIDLPITRQELAEMSGTTLFTASRILSEWDRLGLVEAGRERLVLTKPHRLVEIAEDLPSRDIESH